MFSRRTDLPFDTDDLGRFLPWLIAFMVYLAILAAAGALILGDVAGKWTQGVTDTLTVQLPPADNARDDDERVQAALGLLRAANGVKSAEAFTRDEIQALLRPWLGETVESGDLPMPRLISVEISRAGGVDIAGLRDALRAVAPGISVDDHRVWLNGLIKAIRSAEFVAATVLVLIALVTVGTVVFTTRAGLGLHKDVIEVLHLNGAQDSYIARQFAVRAFWLGVRGGAIGLALAAPTLFGLQFLGARLQSGLIPDLSMSFGQWLALLPLLPAVAAITTVTARITVLKTLARMV